MFDKQPQQHESPSHREESTYAASADQQYQTSGPLNPTDILRFQKTIGNQAVQRMIQREEAEDDAAPNSEIDQDLMEMIDQLIAAMPGGTQAPPMEAITGGTGAELTFGRIRDRTFDLWSQSLTSFTESSRAAADVESPQGEESSTRSPHVDANYSMRRALFLVTWDYQDNADLTQIRDEMRAGSPYMEMVEDEFGANVHRVENPTGSQILAHIQGEIDMLRLELPAGQLAELVVNFSGHGDNGAMIGVDGEFVDMAMLRRIADDAARHSIHITYIVDACTPGALVNVAQGAMSGDIRANEGNLTQQQRERLHLLHNLMGQMFMVNQHASVIASRATGRIPNWENMSGTEQITSLDVDSLVDLTDSSDRTESEQQFINERAQHAREIEASLGRVSDILNGDGATVLNLPNIEQLRQQLDAVTAIHATMGSGMSRALLEPLSRFIDTFNDSVRPVLEELYQASHQQQNQP